MSNTYKLPINLNNRPPQPVDLGWFGCIQFDPSDSSPNYIGLHLSSSATDEDDEWKIYKFTYSGTSVVKIQLSYGSWTNRASLF